MTPHHHMEHQIMTDPKIDPRVVGPRKGGGRYLCGYWRTEYTVTAIEYRDSWEGTSITCKWEDGHSTTHSTPWDPRHDKVVS